MNENTISVTAIASFVETESDAKQNRYIFAYTITIANTGKRTAQLLKRHWVLTNSNGKIEEVDGDGDDDDASTTVDDENGLDPANPRGQALETAR